jgi:hypothetical protein
VRSAIFDGDVEWPVESTWQGEANAAVTRLQGE